MTLARGAIGLYLTHLKFPQVLPRVGLPAERNGIDGNVDVSERTFSMRMQVTYGGDANDVTGLAVDQRLEGGWQPLALGLATPGFDIFVYAAFACQHRYFRVNCAERGLLLASASGAIDVGADADWNMASLRVRFSGRLRAGRAGPGDIDDIVARMLQCPVSRNLRDIPDIRTNVTLE